MTGAGDRDGTEADDRDGPKADERDGTEADDGATGAAVDSEGDDSGGAGTGEPTSPATDRSKPGVDERSERSGVSGSPDSAGDPTDERTELRPVPLGEPQGLDPAVRYYWIVGSAFAAIPLTAVVAVTALTVDGLVTPLPVVPIAAATFLLAVVLGGVRSVLRYRSWEYVVREESLYLSRGVLTQVQTVVPYVRVQHIDTRRGAVERVFGLASLVVYTAGSRGADVTVPGLTPERASALQTRLKRLAIESEEEDAV